MEEAEIAGVIPAVDQALGGGLVVAIVPGKDPGAA